MVHVVVAARRAVRDFAQYVARHGERDGDGSLVCAARDAAHVREARELRARVV